MVLRTVLTHLDCQNSYVSSALNTVIPSKLILKLSQLGISTSLCNWILDFLTDICYVRQTLLFPLHPKHRRATRLCAKPSSVLPVHP